MDIVDPNTQKGLRTLKSNQETVKVQLQADLTLDYWRNRSKHVLLLMELLNTILDLPAITLALNACALYKQEVLFLSCSLQALKNFQPCKLYYDVFDRFLSTVRN